MPDLLMVSQAARELSRDLAETIRPRDISTLFYERALSDAHCPVVGGRRLIPRDYLPAIASELLRRKARRAQVVAPPQKEGAPHG